MWPVTKDHSPILRDTASRSKLPEPKTCLLRVPQREADHCFRRWLVE
jgi:hypothetical protein